MKRKVNYVKLHGTEAFIPGIGGLGTTLPSPSKTLGLDMWQTQDGIECVVRSAGRTIEFIIPLANVQVAVYAPEDKPKLSAVASA